MESLTPDGGVMKRLEVAGEGPRPGANARVYIHYTLRERNGKVLEHSRAREEEFSFRLGKEVVIAGLEILVRSMSPGEIAVGTLKPRYGPVQLRQHKAELEIEVNFLRAEETEVQKTLLKMSTRERLAAAKDFKEEGNRFFKEAKYGRAKNEYEKARDYLNYAFYNSSGKDGVYDGEEGKEDGYGDGEHGNVEKEEAAERGEGEEGEERGGEADGEEEKGDYAADVELREMVRKVKVATLNNLANCYLKEGSFVKAVESTDNVLDIDRHNVKALYRRGLAKMNLGSLEEAKQDLLLAAERNPDDLGVRHELKRLDKLIRNNHEREKRMYSAMFT